MVGDGANGLKPAVPDMAAKNVDEPKTDPTADPVSTLFDSLDLKPPTSPGRKGSASGDTLLAPPTSFKVSPPTPLLGPSPCTCDPTSDNGNSQTNSNDPDHLCPPTSAEYHDGNVSDGDGGDSVLKQAPNGIGLTRQTVHPEDHTDADSKWSLKNVEKWRNTPAVSERISNSRFRACKIMRESDPEHSPAAFALKYPTVGLVIDISGDSPSYDPKSLKAAGIEYRKVPTVSKVPPPVEKVEEFITVAKEFLERHPDQDICIHCHYGWNRTGFVICSYLVQILGVPVDVAIASFAHARPPKGIKHASFKVELARRYGGEEPIESEGSATPRLGAEVVEAEPISVASASTSGSPDDLQAVAVGSSSQGMAPGN